MPYKDKVTDKMSWADIPTCKEQGLDVDYLMLRGIFMPGGVTPDQVKYYVGLFKKVHGDAGVEDVHGAGRVQHTSLERQGVRRLGRARRSAPRRR